MYYKLQNSIKTKRFDRFEGVGDDVGEDDIGHFSEKKR